MISNNMQLVPAQEPTHRMYIDEFGDAQTKRMTSVAERYLTVAGVISDLSHISFSVAPDLDDLKSRYFDQHHPDEPVILHRTDIVKRRGAFTSLNDPVRRLNFDSDLFHLIKESNFTVISVTIDKLTHSNQYARPIHPYHYVIECLVERYVWFLNRINGRGDVLIESRNPNDNAQLKKEYERIFEKGTSIVPANEIQQRLTTKELKFKTKDANVAGVQIADILCKPSFIATMKDDLTDLTIGPIDRRYVELLHNQKYFRDRYGKIDNYGKKKLPR